MRNQSLEVPAQVAAFIKEHSTIPGLDVHMKTPRFAYSKVGCFMWNKVFSWIGFPHVKLIEGTDKDGNNIYCLDFIVFGIRTHFACVTPFTAYSLGTILTALYNMRRMNVGLETDVGIFYVPKWAMKEVLKHLTSICQKNEQRLSFLRSAMVKLVEDAEKDAAPTVTTQDVIDAGKSPVLH